MTLQTKGFSKIDAKTRIENLQEAVDGLNILGEGSPLEQPLTDSFLAGGNVNITQTGFYYLKNPNETEMNVTLPTDGSVDNVWVIIQIDKGLINVKDASNTYMTSKNHDNSFGMAWQLYHFKFLPATSGYMTLRVSETTGSLSHKAVEIKNNSPEYALYDYPSGYCIVPKYNSVDSSIAISLSSRTNPKKAGGAFFLLDANKIIGTTQCPDISIKGVSSGNVNHTLTITATDCFLMIQPLETEWLVVDMHGGRSEIISATQTIDNEWLSVRPQMVTTFGNPHRKHYYATTQTFGTTTNTSNIFNGGFQIVAQGEAVAANAKVDYTVKFGSKFKSSVSYRKNDNNSAWDVEPNTIMNVYSSISDGTSRTHNVILFNNATNAPACEFTLLMERESDSRTTHWHGLFDWYETAWF